MSFPESEYFSIKEFAFTMKLHPNTVRRAIKKGRLNFLRLGSGKRPVYRIPKSEIGRIALFDMEEIIEKMIEKRLQESPNPL